MSQQSAISEPPLRIGVAGLGYWGPNLARNFAALPGCELAWCCDSSPAARARIEQWFPSARFTGELDQLLSDATLDAIALATPSDGGGGLRVVRLERLQQSLDLSRAPRAAAAS